MVVAAPAPAAKGVETVSLKMAEMLASWQLIEALRGGTEGMRKQAQKYLPQEPGEETKAYENRLARSFLFPGYTDTVAHLASRPFGRSARLDADSPKVMQGWVDDVDLEGTSLTDFAKAALDDALHHGLTHALVEFPTVTRALSRSAERAMGLRPYWVHVSAPSIIAWRSRRWNGRETLTHLRIWEEATVREGEFSETAVLRIRVFDRLFPGERTDSRGRRLPNDQGVTLWRLFEKNAAGAWIEIDSGTLSINEIPLCTFYAKRKGFMVGESPLAELAWKNLEHWQSASDQKHILHVARVPILFGSGISADDLKDKNGNPIKIGPNQMLMVRDANAKLGFVEHTGKAIEAGRTDLRDLLEDMMRLGMRPLVERTGDATATEAAIDHAESVSELKAWVRGEEIFLARLFDLGARWIKVEGEASVDIFDDFGVSLSNGKDLDALAAARTRGDLSRSTWWREAVRRGLLAESFSAEAERVLIEDEAGESVVDDGDDEGDGDPEKDPTEDRLPQ